MNEKFKIIGHRGAKGEMPENSVEGLAFLLKHGIKWAEIDLRLDENGEIVLHHDKQCNSHITEKKKDFFTLPKFKQILKQFPELNFNIEIKEKNVVDKLSEIEELKTNPERFIISSFFHTQVKLLKKMFPDIPCLFLISGDLIDIEKYVDSHNGDGVVFEYEFFNEKSVVNMLKNGKQVYCYSVDDIEDALYFYKLGLNGIITNYPVKMKKYLEQTEHFKND